MHPVYYIVLIIIIVSFGLYFRKYPKFPPMERKSIEYFSSAATGPSEPTCVRRNADAQALLQIFPQHPNISACKDAIDRIELKLIINKLTCVDADVNKNGIPGYNTVKLPYNTSHDTEPLINFVGRCLNNGVNTRDIDLIMTKYENRGIELIRRIGKRANIDTQRAYDHYRALVNTTYAVLSSNCIKQANLLDRPVGPRDPGYTMPYNVARLASFSMSDTV